GDGGNLAADRGGGVGGGARRTRKLDHLELETAAPQLGGDPLGAGAQHGAMVDRSMSSLPPYNPAPSERRLWLLNSEGSAADRERLLGATGVSQVLVVVSGDGLLDQVRAMGTDAAVVAPEAVLEELVLGLVGGH